ncbi:P-loop containing nucleoside triphosphate hydrolase protein [Crepidotus variabilis]|uniref:RNA helicase n=1 Tax=Crepidotus variabilis TaxID=179855 RepID=A0A9P6JQB6_9AGAR|nr:P-loop containing nucleoside triphosphate hydrolase protein [Crepidotus variabilis]
MSNDELEIKEKKLKSGKSESKSKSGKGKEVETAEPDHADQEDGGLKREKKKDQKKREKVEGTPEPTDGDAPSLDSKGDGMDVDLKGSEPVKKSKKHKRKEKEARKAALEQDTTTIEVDTHEPEVQVESKKDKKKKRRRDEDSEQPANSSESHKEKKKRRKEESSSTTDPINALSPTTTITATVITSEITPTTPSPSADEATAFLAKNTITISSPSSESPALIPVLVFSQLTGLGVPEDIVEQAFKGFKEPTPIQACTWPPALEGKDVVGIAETGSGKTLAFGIPALCQLIASPSQSSISVLVVAPTRELAIQTHDTLSVLGKPFGIASVAVFGGVPKEPQIKMLRKVTAGKKKENGGLVTRIVVGTPGRILDLMQEGVCDLSGVDYLVLDEADRMLDKGFENDIRTIIEATKPSENRQTMMFSATWPEAVRRLASTFQKSPVRVTVGSDDLTANSRVEQSVEVFDDARSKDQRLMNVLKSFSHKKKATSPDESRILVFALYKKEASRVEQMLHRQGYSVGALHGDMSQTARMEALDNFKTGKTGLLVATDVAARGLDIPNVGVVVNYTFPLTIEDYIHRIGRTGRGGKHGKSVTFFTGDVHEKALAGEFARVLREGGFDYDALKKFPMTIKKREHSAYGAFYRDDIPVPKGPTKIVF